MTIRLRCAECRRKLKVPDEALGKKVQCPACGARFLGRPDANLPPLAPALQKPVLTEPIPTAAPIESPAPPFPDMQLEEPSSIEVVEPIALDDPLMEETLLEGLDAVDEAESAEPAALEEEGVEPIVMEDDPFADLSEAVPDTDAIDVVEEAEEEIEPEIVDEEESAEETKPRPKKKKSRSTLYAVLAVGAVLLLACIGGGYAVYLYVNGKLF